MATTRAPRNTLTRERLVSGALELLTNHGLGALTIRALANDLGVRPMSIYHYTPSKEELLDHLVDVVFGEVYLPDGEGPWREEIGRRCRSLRETLLKRRWALSVLESRAHPGPATLANHEAVLEVLRRAGFTVSAAAKAFATIDAYVFGFVLQEIMLDTVGLTEDPQSTASLIDMTAYPRMLEIAAFYIEAPAHTFGDSFEVGLELVLDGVGRLAGAADPGEEG